MTHETLTLTARAHRECVRFPSKMSGTLPNEVK